MQATLIIIAVLCLIFFGGAKIGIEITFLDVLKHKRFFLILFFIVLLVVILYLNRYSVLAFICLNHNGYPIFESLGKSLTMSNDITFFIGIIEEIANSQGIVIPPELTDTMKNLINETYGKIGSYGDLIEIIQFVW